MNSTLRDAPDEDGSLGTGSTTDMLVHSTALFSKLLFVRVFFSFLFIKGLLSGAARLGACVSHLALSIASVGLWCPGDCGASGRRAPSRNVGSARRQASNLAGFGPVGIGPVHGLKSATSARRRVVGGEPGRAGAAAARGGRVPRQPR